MTLPRTLIAVLLLLHNADAVEKPHPMLLHSAYTPFSDTDGSLDVSGVPRLAAQAKKMGVNTIFVGGSMGEFDTMSISERKEAEVARLEGLEEEVGGWGGGWVGPSL